MTSLLLSLIVSFQARAVVLPGAFIAQQCGAQTIDVAHKDTQLIEAACVGFIDGTATRAVQFTLTNNDRHLFKVVSQSNMMMAMMSGAKMSIFRLVDENGLEIAMKAIINKDGSVRSLSGEFDTNYFLVPTLEHMVTLQ